MTSTQPLRSCVNLDFSLHTQQGRLGELGRWRRRAWLFSKRRRADFVSTGSCCARLLPKEVVIGAVPGGRSRACSSAAHEGFRPQQDRPISSLPDPPLVASAHERIEDESTLMNWKRHVTKASNQSSPVLLSAEQQQQHGVLPPPRELDLPVKGQANATWYEILDTSSFLLLSILRTEQS